MFESLEENEPKKKDPPNYIGTVIGLGMLPVFLLFRHFGGIDMALPASVYMGMILLTVAFRWNLRAHVWFWVVIALVLILHVLLLLKVSWQHFTVNRITLLPLAVADLLVILGIIQFVEKFIVRAPSTGDE
jgi:hypothetical protein